MLRPAGENHENIHGSGGDGLAPDLVCWTCVGDAMQRGSRTTAQWWRQDLPGLLRAIRGVYAAVLLIRLSLRLLHDEPATLPLH